MSIPRKECTQLEQTYVQTSTTDWLTKFLRFGRAASQKNTTRTNDHIVRHLPLTFPPLPEPRRGPPTYAVLREISMDAPGIQDVENAHCSAHDVCSDTRPVDTHPLSIHVSVLCATFCLRPTPVALFAWSMPAADPRLPQAATLTDAICV